MVLRSFSILILGLVNQNTLIKAFLIGDSLCWYNLRSIIVDLFIGIWSSNCQYSLRWVFEVANLEENSFQSCQLHTVVVYLQFHLFLVEVREEVTQTISCTLGNFECDHILHVTEDGNIWTQVVLDELKDGVSGRVWFLLYSELISLTKSPLDEHG